MVQVLSCNSSLISGGIGDLARPIESSGANCGEIGQTCCPGGSCFSNALRCEGGVCQLIACADGEFRCKYIDENADSHVVPCCDLGKQCSEDSFRCQPTSNCQELGATCVNDEECCLGNTCEHSRCEKPISSCVALDEPCSRPGDNVECCAGNTCLNGKCTYCLNDGVPGEENSSDYQPCCFGLSADGETCKQCNSYQACEYDNECCPGLRCLDESTPGNPQQKVCALMAAPGNGCTPGVVLCPPETPLCQADDAGVPRCVRGAASPDAGTASDAGVSPKPSTSCHHDVECNQLVGEACCLSPSTDSNGFSLPPAVEGRKDLCTPDKKNTCYQGFICGGANKECLGSANPKVCDDCVLRCVQDSVCDPIWEDSTCIDCQSTCSPCTRNGAPVMCGIDPSCGSAQNCGTCSTGVCDPHTNQCTAGFDACSNICASIRNCRDVIAQAQNVSCQCSPNFSCGQDECSPDGMMCESVRITLTGEYESEECYWCGGPNISASQCIACGGYVQGAICAGSVTPNCPLSK